MDAIEFRIVMEDVSWSDDPWPTIHPAINGVLLREIARIVEEPFAEREGQPDLAGSYMGLSVSGGGAWATGHFAGRPVERSSDGRTFLLGCTCGEVGCWPLMARIDITETQIVWWHFRTGFRAWDLSSIGPFLFDKAAYLENLQLGAEGESTPSS